MKTTIKKKKMWVKVVALSLVSTFMGWSPATAAISDRSVWHQRGKTDVRTSVSTNSLAQETLQKTLFSNYFVPETAGTINEVWAPKGMTKDVLTSSKLVIHVRDAHCNYEAQTNIASIIDNFTKSNGVDFVSVEGAEGTIDYSLLNAYPDYQLRGKVSDYFVKLGRLAGAEFANINAKKYNTLFGAESINVYNSNLNNFRQTLTYKTEGVEFVKQIKEALATLKANMYSPELKEVEEMSSLYNNREISFVDYCQYLYNLPAAENVRSGYKNFALLMEAIRAQSLVDFSKIEDEKTELVNELARKVTREDLTALSQATIDFRRGKISTAEYYGSLSALAKETQVDLASYTNLRPYMLYLSVYEQISSADLFKEKETLEAEVKRSMFKNMDQARLDKLSKNADILEKIFAVRLTNADLAYFQEFRTDFTAWEFKSFINEQAPKYNLTFNIDFSKDPIEKYLPKLEAFYMEAKTRDNLLIDNTLAQMDLEGAKAGVLVAGGFHTAGITASLRSKNIPYMVVTPRILREDVNNPYLQLISGEQTPIDKFLTIEHLFSLALPAGTKATAEKIVKLLIAAGYAPLSKDWVEKAKKAGVADPTTKTSTGVIASSETGVTQIGDTVILAVKVEDEKTAKADLEKAKKNVVKQLALIAQEIGVEENLIGEIKTITVSDLGLLLVQLDAGNEENADGIRGVLYADEVQAYRATLSSNNVQSFSAFIKGAAKGVNKDFFDQLNARVVALLLENGVDVEAIVTVVNDQYEGVLEVGTPVESAIKKQDIAFVLEDQILISENHLARLAAFANEPDKLEEAVAKLEHEIMTLALRRASPGRSVIAIHNEVKSKVDAKFTENLEGIDDLEALDNNILNSVDVAANAALAKAEVAFLKNPTEENANAVKKAYTTLLATTTADNIVVREEINKIPQRLAEAGSKGLFQGIDTTPIEVRSEDGSVEIVHEATAKSVPSIGRKDVPMVGSKIHPESVKALADNNIFSLRWDPAVSKEAREVIYKRIFDSKYKLNREQDATAIVAGFPELQAVAYRQEDGGYRLVIQPKTADQKTVALVKAETDIINLGVKQLKAEDKKVVVIVDLATTVLNPDESINQGSLEALYTALAEINLNKSIKVFLTSTDPNKDISKVVAELTSEKSAVKEQIITTEAEYTNLNSNDFRFITTAEGKAKNKYDEQKTIIIDAAKEGLTVTPFDAAVPLAVLSMAYQGLTIDDLDLTMQASLKIFLGRVTEEGLKIDEVQINKFLNNPSTISLGRVEEHKLNIIGASKLGLSA